MTFFIYLQRNTLPPNIFHETIILYLAVLFLVYDIEQNMHLNLILSSAVSTIQVQTI